MRGFRGSRIKWEINLDPQGIYPYSEIKSSVDGQKARDPMSEVKITTNHHWRDFTYRSDVPPAVLADQFDWTDRDHEEHGGYSDGFLCYRGVWYHLADFMTGGLAPGDTWHGAHGDSYFSGVLIRLSDDGEQYQIATYCQ